MSENVDLKPANGCAEIDFNHYRTCIAAASKKTFGMAQEHRAESKLNIYSGKALAFSSSVIEGNSVN